jgi:hypothetical protein
MHKIADIEVQEKAGLSEKLDAAVAAAHSDPRAKGGMGVLITRHKLHHFTVTLSPDVPFGLAQEKDQA